MTTQAPFFTRLSVYQHVASIQDLRAKDMIAVVSTVKQWALLVMRAGGYLATGDGGDGDFWWDPTSTDADNGGTVIQISGLATGRFKRQFGGAVNPAWFGMVADTRALTDVILVAGSATITSPSLVAADAGKVVQIASRSNPATGTVATLSASALPSGGTVSTTIGSNVVTGLGTNFTADVHVGQLFKIGAVVGKVTSITSGTVIRTDQAEWGSTAAGQAMTLYGLVGTSTLFTAELFLGQGIYVGATFCSVVAIGSNTRASVWPLPVAVVSGQTLYRNPSIAAQIATVNLSAHTAALSNMSSSVAVAASGVTAYIGDGLANDAAMDAAIAAASLSGHDLEIPGASTHYMMWNGPAAMATVSHGLHIFGHGWSDTNAAYYGDPAWLNLTGIVGTTLRIANPLGRGLVTGAAAVYNLRFSTLALIGPGIGNTSIGHGMEAGHEGVFDSGGNTRRKLALLNWWRGANIYSSFVDYWDTCRIQGCAQGAVLNSVTTQEWHAGSYDHNNVAIQLQDIEVGSFSGGAQGNLTYAFLLNQANAVRFHALYCENRPTAGDGRAGSFQFDTTGGKVIQDITFTEVHAGDVYCWEPVGNGLISRIHDVGCNFKAVSVRPKWSNWDTEGIFSHVDYTAAQGGIRAQGGGAIGYTDWPAVGQQIVPSAGAGNNPYTPDVTATGQQFVIAITENITINDPVMNGVSASGAAGNYQVIEFHFRANGAFTVTWGANYNPNPWSDAGAGSGPLTSTIRFRHTGSGRWECIGYMPYYTAPQTYTVTNHTDRRTLDETGTTLVQLANVVGTLLNDMKVSARAVK